MPYLELAPEARIHCTVDDWTDPWTKLESALLIHGFAESTEAWRAWVPYLGRRFRVVRYDQVGFGRSSRVSNEATFTTAGLVEAAARVIETLAGGSAHVVGAKSGGLVAIELARLKPRLVKTLTLASVPLAAPQPDAWLRHMETHGMRSWARQTMPPRLGASMPPEGMEWWIDLMGGTPLATARAYMRWVSGIDVGATLDEVKCSVLVLTTSTPRRAYSRSDTERYRECLPHARIVALERDGYHVAASYPDECAPLARDFMLAAS
jgi:3-oxoadipate enol-lactonase